MAYPQAFFFIRCRLNGLVFDVEADNRSPGARVVTWNQKPSDHDNQLWFEDYQTGTIRSKMHGFCLDLAGDTLVVNPVYPGNPNQQWMRADPFIQNRFTPNRVLDVAGGNSSPGARIIAFDRNGGTNQKFDFQFIGVPAYPPGAAYPPTQIYPPGPGYPPAASLPGVSYPPAASIPGRRFFIVSELNGKVLDIEGANPSRGANVVMWSRKSIMCNNQLWYTDGQGIIHSCLNEFVLTAKEDGDHIRMKPYKGKPSQRWVISGNRIMRDNKNCLDIEGGRLEDGVKVIQWNYKGSANQHWRIEYV